MKDLLIIGAGPYGLATAAFAKSLGCDVEIVGMPMSFWREHVPKGLLLRTGKDEHFDVTGIHTMDAFFAECDLSEEETTPLPVSRYLDYADWFIKKKDLLIINDWVRKLTAFDDGFLAELIGGRKITAKKVVVAVGMADSKFIPRELSVLIPEGFYSHSSDYGDLKRFKNKTVLIVGGRQSAFETAVLLVESDAQSVHIVCRHPIPTFTECNFSFMHEFIANVEANPNWYRQLDVDERQKWDNKAYTEGRLKLEYWLEPRLKTGKVNMTENANLTQVELSNQQLRAVLDNQQTIVCDHIIFATGFKPDINQLCFLNRGGLTDQLNIQTGSPVLDDSFQSSQKGLYFIGMFSMADFGYSFGFATGALIAAKMLLRSVVAQSD